MVQFTYLKIGRKIKLEEFLEINVNPYMLASGFFPKIKNNYCLPSCGGENLPTFLLFVCLYG
jgi:hypothetical protein